MSMLMANLHFSTTSGKIKMLFTGLSRSVLEETVPELLSTPRGRQLWKLSISPAHIYVIHRTGSPYPKKLCLLKKLCRRSCAEEAVLCEYGLGGYWRPNNIYMRLRYRPLSFIWVETRMDTSKYGDTLKFMYIKHKPILVVLPKVFQV